MYQARRTRPKPPSPFGKSLKRLRKASGLTIEGLATKTAKSGTVLDKRYLSQLETGQIQEPGLNNGERIAFALGVSIKVVNGFAVLVEPSP